MKEQLEIKQLKGYLGYRLKVKCLDFQRDYVGNEFDYMTGLDQWSKNGILWSILTEGGSRPSFDRIMPVLYPLSYLTKEIEHKGETVVPIDVLNDLYGYTEVKLTHYLNSGLGWSIDGSMANTAIEFDDMYLPIEKLYEWHFDIHALIPKGLAVDINTL